MCQGRLTYVTSWQPIMVRASFRSFGEVGASSCSASCGEIIGEAMVEVVFLNEGFCNTSQISFQSHGFPGEPAVGSANCHYQSTGGSWYLPLVTPGYPRSLHQPTSGSPLSSVVGVG